MLVPLPCLLYEYLRTVMSPGKAQAEVLPVHRCSLEVVSAD